MELYIQELPTFSNISDTKLALIEAISKVIHHDTFRSKPGEALEPLHNFQVLVRENQPRPFQPPGPRRFPRPPRVSGTVTLPTASLGKRFLAQVSANPLLIFQHFVVNFRESCRQGRSVVPHPEVIRTLKNTAFKDRIQVLTEQLEHEKLQRPFSISCVEFGRPLLHEGKPAFASEFSLFLATGECLLSFDTVNNLLLVRWTFAFAARSLIIRMKSIQRLEADQLSVTFWLDCPPTFEYIHVETIQPDQHNNAQDSDDEEANESGVEEPTETRYRTISPTSSDLHIFPYVSDRLRITFGSQEGFQEFCTRKTTVRLPKIIHLTRPSIEKKLYSLENLTALEPFLVSFTIPVAFQIETLLSHALLDPSQIIHVCQSLVQVDSDHAERALVHYVASLTQTLADHHHVADGTVQNSVFEGTTYLETLANSLQSTLNDHRALDPRILSGEVFPCRTVSITPTQLILEGPALEQSNSVLRTYEDTHNFLRISIRDENGLTLRSDRDVDILGLLKTRYMDFLTKGLVLCGRKFEFLGYSSSALRDHQAWFVCPFYKTSLINAASIRQRLGDFTKVIDIPARYMARVAQAFTSTRKSLTLTPDQILRIQDVERNGSCFTDGVGTISLDLAHQVVDVLLAALPSRKRRHQTKSTCFQIRLGGFKGMLSVDSTLKQSCVCVRPSMDKFVSPDSLTLDIAGVFSKPLPAYLNRPMIKVLEDLGIHDEVFLTLQRRIVQKVEHSRTNMSLAAELMQQLSISHPSGLPSLLRYLGNLLGNDANPRSEFVEECYDLMIMQSLRDLKYRARIPLEDSYTLVGVADEDDVLAPNNIYACIQYPGKAPFYLEGRVAISRSPCLHPGDVRVVCAVGKLDLEHAPRLTKLVNCVAFSVKGVRSLPSCLGGGDLDGDLYTLIAQPDLIPSSSKLYPPASYDPPQMKRLDRPCTIEDGAAFFLDYISSDLVGVIAARHLHIADQQEDGTRDELCLELAALHSDAVDYPKTGVPVKIGQLPRAPTRMKPDFMCPEHNARREGDDYYESKKVLGKLFRQIPADKIDVYHHTHTGIVSHAASRSRPNKGQPFDKLDPSETISKAVRRALKRAQGRPIHPDMSLLEEFKALLRTYGEDLMKICKLNTLSRKKDRHLSEAEAFLGVITDATIEKRMKKETINRLEMQTEALFDSVKAAIIGFRDDEGYESDVVLLDADRDDPQAIERDRQINRAYTACTTAKDIVYKIKGPISEHRRETDYSPLVQDSHRRA